MARTMTTAERAARDALKPYVRAGQMRQGVVNETVRNGLPIIEPVIRDALRGDFGSAFFYGMKVTKAREEYDAATSTVARHVKLAGLAMAEMTAAVYKAVRVDYKTAEEIEHEDREAPLLANYWQATKEAVRRLNRTRP